MPKLSVIIVNWKSERFLRECLPTVLAGMDGLEYEVVVVDSASPGDGLSALERQFSSVRFIRCTENVGFGRANNLGYMSSSGELLLFLNPDTIVMEGAIAEMVRTIESLPSAGIVGCKLLNTDGSVQLSAIQPFPTILNQVFGAEWLQMKMPECPLWRLDPLFSSHDRPVRVQGVSGACLLIRRDVFAEIGCFSPEYFMYAEDVDLCHKAVLAGWQTWLTSSAVVVHHGGGSSRQRTVSTWSIVVQQQAKYAYFVKFHGRLYARSFRAAMAMAAAVRLVLLAASKVLPVSEPQSRSAATTKWIAILKWSVSVGEPC